MPIGLFKSSPNRLIRSLCLQVTCKARFVKPFIIGDEMKDVVVKRGQALAWDIKYGGEPEPEVEWYFNDKVIQVEER